LLLDSNGHLKISDFGMARLYIGDPDASGEVRKELLHTACGTPNYVAPEVLTCQGYDGQKADVWSIGVILFVLLAGYLPFEESTVAALFQKIQNADFKYPPFFTESAKIILVKILVVDPEIRMSLSEIKNDPWLTNPDVAVPQALSRPLVGTNKGDDDSDKEDAPRAPVPPQASKADHAHNNHAAPAQVNPPPAPAPVKAPSPAPHAAAPAPAPAAAPVAAPAATPAAAPAPATKAAAPAAAPAPDNKATTTTDAPSGCCVIA
jgi:serine/threonine protein kinase